MLWLAAPSERQLKALNSLLNQGLTDQRRAVRLEVLRMITGNRETDQFCTAYCLHREGPDRLSQAGY